MLPFLCALLGPLSVVAQGEVRCLHRYAHGAMSTLSIPLYRTLASGDSVLWAHRRVALAPNGDTLYAHVDSHAGRLCHTQFRYHPGGGVRQVTTRCHPDGGIQRWVRVLRYDEEGQLLSDRTEFDDGFGGLPEVQVRGH